MAKTALRGVGDPRAGEWRETGAAFHLRRRLTFAEQIRFGISLRDIRGTPEEAERLDVLFREVPPLRSIFSREPADGR